MIQNKMIIIDKQDDQELLLGKINKQKTFNKNND